MSAVAFYVGKCWIISSRLPGMGIPIAAPLEEASSFAGPLTVPGREAIHKGSNILKEFSYFKIALCKIYYNCGFPHIPFSKFIH